jgi:hypothetical protein
VRQTIGEIQTGLDGFAGAVSEATRLTAAVPREASPDTAIAGLAPVQETVTAARDAATRAAGQVDEAQRLTATVLRGGQPGPLLATLTSIKQVFVPLAQRAGNVGQSIEAAIREARQLGKLTWAGGLTPASPTTAVTADPTAAASDRDGATPDKDTTLMPWSRRPTGIVNGSPTGRRTRIPPKEDYKERRSLELENACADVVAGKGYRVHQNPTRLEVAHARRSTGDTGDPKKEPDYLIEGHVFDCYAPTSSVGVRAVWTAVSAKVKRGQTQRVILNLEDWRGDFAALQKQFADWPIEGLRELVAVRRGGTIIQIV